MIPSKVMTAAWLAAGAAVLAGCQPTQDAQRPGGDPISLDQVSVLADSICGASRPSFADAPVRMQQEGLTVVKDGRAFSPTRAVSAAVTTTPDGRVLCSVRASFAGNEFTLDKAMTDLFGQPRLTDKITPPARVYNLGANGNLLLIIRAKPARTVTTYELGYAQGI